jgi:DNA-binding HxlR family transcriptional regulator
MKPDMKSCNGVEKAALLLSDTWTMLIMHALQTGPKGFCEMERELAGISTRTLTSKLKKLEEEKMVKKNTASFR